MSSSSSLLSNLSLDTAIDPHPLTASPQTALTEVISLMSRERGRCDLSETVSEPAREVRGSCVLAVEGSRLVGLLTERDLVRLSTQYHDLGDLTLGEVMTRDLITLQTYPNPDIFTAIALMRQHQIRHLPLVSETGEVLGLIASESIRARLQPADLFKLRQVGEAMTPEVIHALPGTSVLELARLMTEYRVSCVVIVEPQIAASHAPRPLGIVTERDIVQFQALQLDFRRVTAAQIMSAPLWSLRPTDHLWTAHQEMQRRRVRRLVVCDEREQLLGIVTQTSLLQTLSPVELYQTVRALQQEVCQLQTERLEQIHQNRTELIRQEHTQSRLELQQERDFTTAILDTVATLIVVLDRQGRIVKFNQACARATGYSLAEVQNRVFWDLLVPEPEVEGVRDTFARLQSGRSMNCYENSWVTKTGDRRLISWSNTVLFNDAGEVEFIIGTGEDITDRRRAELELEERKEAYRKLSEELELQVARQTEELARINEELKCEIAECKQTERDLQLARERLDYLLKSSSAIIYSCEPETFRSTFVSENVRDILGYDAQNFDDDGDFWRDRIHPDDRDLVFGMSPQELPDRYCYEYRFLHRDGSYRWMRDEFKLVRDGAGNPLEWVGYWIDIGDRKRAEIALKESEKRYRQIVETTLEGVWIIAQNNITTFVNRRMAEMLGYTAEEMLGQSLMKFMESGDRNFAAQNLVNRHQGIGETHDFKFICKNGDPIWVLVSGTPIFGHGGEYQGSLALMTDITERKQMEAALRESEQRFRVIFDEADIGIGELDLEGNFILANPKLAEITGYSVGEILHKNVRDITHLEDVANTRTQLLDLLEQKIPKLSYEKRFVRKDGSPIWVNISGSLIVNDAGEPQYILGIAQNINDRKLAEMALQEREAILNSLYNSTTLMMGVVELLEDDILHIWDNHATAGFFGILPEEMKNKKSSQLGIPESTIALWLNHYRQSQKLGKPVQFEYVHSTATAEYCILATANPILNSDSDHIRFCYIAEDITKRKQTELALYQTTRNILQSQKIAGIGTWGFDAVSRQITWSEEVFKIFGIDPTQPHPSLEELVEIIHPDDRFIHEEQLRRTLTMAEPFNVEYRLFRPSGEMRYLRARGEVEMDSRGQVVRLFGLAMDITDKKLAEIALSASEAKYRRLIEQMPAATYTASFDEICSTLYISPQIERLLGFSPSEWLENANFWMERVHPDDRDRVLREIGEETQRDGGFSVEYRMVSRSGEVLWVRDRARTVADEGGQPLFIQGILIDITEQKNAEIALQESEEKFRQIAESVREVFVITSFDGQEMLYINPAYEAIWGQSCESLYRNPRAWMESVHPEDRERVAQAYRRQIQGPNSFDEEYRIVRPDGQIRWVEVRIFPVKDESGNIYRFAGIVEDTTERKRAMTKLKESNIFIKKIADTLPNILYINDIIQSRMIYVNQSIRDVLGYSSDEIRDLGDNFLKRHLHPDDRRAVQEHYRRLEGAQDGEIHSVEYRLQRSDGQWRWLFSRDVIFSRTAGGKVQEILGTATDLTERKQTEEALQKTYQRLKQRNREMEIISDMMEFLQACDKVEDGYGAIAEFLKQLFPQFSGAVLLVENNADYGGDQANLEAVSAFGELRDSEIKFNLKQCWALRRGQIHAANHRQPGLFCQHVHLDLPPANTVCIPLIAQTKILGLFYLRTQLPSSNWPYLEQLARTVAEQLSLALSNLKLQEQLRLESIRDPLTGLFNRRYLQETLNQEFAKARRNQNPLCIIMVDIDHFKGFNDTFGHEAGDFVLQIIAKFLQENVRASDVACRYGGEELTLILPQTSLETAIARAEFLCRGIRGLQLRHQSRDLGQITASFGVACFPEHAQIPDDLLKMADDALYRAKELGRDRVIVWE
ncbi:PAS domain S-box protein [Lyngbya sp. CCY1209]|uniref:PAS domain S-box protein n=1 Tax=Lyngbya sp. CCY1209 TaxID=2886103 RepID=UPI002D21541D|nr:PAS domain S-box protein [Lyngbya sp. CCY1209]MEB3887389.1 PAS domain S-box protein [Lyngbya sp. CCY1209]